jgi:hypothetical protein
MMKKIKKMNIKFFLVIVLLSSSYSANAQKPKCTNCEMLDSILCNPTLRQSLGVNSSNKVIRIIDTKKYLKKCKVLKSHSYYIGNHVVGITDIIPLDINTGLFADIVILNISKKDNKIQFDIFFANSKCENNIKYKYMCRTVFTSNKNTTHIETIGFSHIQ